MNLLQFQHRIRSPASASDPQPKVTYESYIRFWMKVNIRKLHAKVTIRKLTYESCIIIQKANRAPKGLRKLLHIKLSWKLTRRILSGNAIEPIWASKGYRGISLYLKQLHSFLYVCSLNSQGILIFYVRLYLPGIPSANRFLIYSLEKLPSPKWIVWCNDVLLLILHA